MNKYLSCAISAVIVNLYIAGRARAIDTGAINFDGPTDPLRQSIAASSSENSRKLPPVVGRPIVNQKGLVSDAESDKVSHVISLLERGLQVAPKKLDEVMRICDKLSSPDALQSFAEQIHNYPVETQRILLLGQVNTIATWKIIFYMAQHPEALTITPDEATLAKLNQAMQTVREALQSIDDNNNTISQQELKEAKEALRMISRSEMVMRISRKQTEQLDDDVTAYRESHTPKEILQFIATRTRLHAEENAGLYAEYQYIFNHAAVK